MSHSDPEKQLIQAHHNPNSNSNPTATSTTTSTNTNHLREKVDNNLRSYKLVRCNPVWFSILFLAFLCLTLIFATMSISTGRSLDLHKISYKKLLHFGEHRFNHHLSSSSCEDEQDETFITQKRSFDEKESEEALIKSNLGGKYLLEMLKRGHSKHSNGTGVIVDLSTVSRDLPSTITPTQSHSSSSISASSAKGHHSASSSSHGTSSSSGASATNQPTNSDSTHLSSATGTTGISSTTGLSSTGTGTLSGSATTQSDASSTETGISPSKTPFNSTTSDLNPIGTGGGSSPITTGLTTGTDGLPTTLSDGSPSPTHSGGNNGAGSSPNDDDSQNDSPSSNNNHHQGQSVTRKTLYTTTLPNGAVSTLTSVTVVEADAQQTAGTGGTKTKGISGLQTSIAMQINSMTLGQALGIMFIMVLGAL